MAHLTRDFVDITNDHAGIEYDIDTRCTPDTVVVASICETQIIGGVVTPGQWAASMRIDNVVPRDNLLTVRGEIGWDSDIAARIFFIKADPANLTPNPTLGPGMATFTVDHKDLHDHKGFEVKWPNGDVAPDSIVEASICEVQNIDGVVTPGQWAASMHVDNVVPLNGEVLVRGEIGWDSDIDARVSILIGNKTR